MDLGTANRKGFTLVELMIVVLVLGILSIIGIYQNASYRMRGYNAAAVSDLSHFRTCLEAYYAENHRYPGP